MALQDVTPAFLQPFNQDVIPSFMFGLATVENVAQMNTTPDAKPVQEQLGG